MERLFKFLNDSKTAWHAVKNVEEILLKNGFKKLNEQEKWIIERGERYYLTRNDSSLIAFIAGDDIYNITASHLDSPCFKLKRNARIQVENYAKLNLERYGGGMFYTWFDTPVTVAGRIIVENGEKLESKVFTSTKKFVIPSVALHLNRTANDELKLNAQIDISPVTELGSGDGLKAEIDGLGDGKILGGDLYVVSATEPYACGYSGEMFCSPRMDNLTSAYASISALLASKPKNTAVIFLADNEEVGSRTKQGAGSTFLLDVLKRINASRGGDFEDLQIAFSKSMMVSCDNAHALHPNHPELSDPTNKTLLGGGIVIKHHANHNYTTDGLSSAAIAKIFNDAGVKYQHFHMRSDLKCGETLGAISSTHVSIKSVDIGMAQLAMHSCVETASYLDHLEIIKGITAFFNSDLSITC